jgi:hypothetical protein
MGGQSAAVSRAATTAGGGVREGVAVSGIAVADGVVVQAGGSSTAGAGVGEARAGLGAADPQAASKRTVTEQKRRQALFIRCPAGGLPR